MSKKNSGEKVSMSIGVKIALIFVLVFVIIVTSVGFIVSGKSKEIMTDSYENLTLRMLDQIDFSIRNYLAKYDSISQLLSDSNNVKNIFSLDSNEAEMFEEFENVVRNNDEITAVYFAGKDKSFYVRPQFDLPEGWDPTGRPWYIKAIEEDGLVWTEPYIDVQTGDLVVSAAKPVYSHESSQPIGVIGIDILLTTLSESVNEIKVGETGYAVILTGENLFMTHPNKDVVMTPMGISEIVEAIASSDRGITHYEWEEANGDIREKFAVFTKVEELGWTILATMYIDEITAGTKQIINTIIMTSLVVFFVAMIIVFVFSKSISKNIRSLLESMEKIKNGDITATIEVKSRDEIGVMAKNYNETIRTIAGFFKTIRTASGELISSSENLAATSEETTASATEISRTVDEIAKGATDQALDAEKGVMIAKELSEKFIQLNENTQSMLNTASEVMNSNENGYKAVEGLITKTALTDEANEKIEKVIAELNIKTRDIGGILDTISAISVQTNLLALNASIEAARAGEHGRGFAVVAEEIRKLAEESSGAADKVRDIVVNIQGDSKRTVESMAEVKQISSEQRVAVDEVKDSFKSISESIDDISTKIEKMNDFISVLNTDKDRIVDSIENISAVSEETAAGSEEVTATVAQQTMAIEEVSKAAEKLNHIAQKLNEELKQFVID